MSKFFALATFVIAGIIVADILIHPQGTAAASAGARSLEVPAFQSLLGTVPSN
jgi:hypothetical protein